MRSTTLVLGAVLLVGCAERGTSFDMLSVLPGDTHGVALEGERARVGMAGQICDVDARTASVGADLDAADGQERVLDARGDLVVGELDGRLFLDDGAATLFDVQVLDAGITPAGEPVSVLRGANGRCDVAFGSTAYTLEGLSCAVAPGFAVAPGAVWLADGRSVAR
ncbi:MAG: hypothetical protein KC656_26195, partial [Myxococcales bacterium]|nr:hypothetical protein [Myxococcales bacterium]